MAWILEILEILHSQEIRAHQYRDVPKVPQVSELSGEGESFPDIPEDGVPAGANEDLLPTRSIFEGKKPVIQVKRSYIA